jgi:hypothetical protein
MPFMLNRAKPWPIGLSADEAADKAQGPDAAMIGQ